jgi:hypothetical protein
MRKSNVADTNVSIPIDHPNIMGPALHKLSVEYGFDLHKIMRDTTGVKAHAGAPAARYNGIKNGRAYYTLYRRTGRDE